MSTVTPWVQATVTIPDDLLSHLCANAKSRGLDSSPSKLVVGLVEQAVFATGEGPYAVDSLTNCKSRARFSRDLNKATWGASWTADSMYEDRFLCIDMDNFKAYLDVHGL